MSSAMQNRLKCIDIAIRSGRYPSVSSLANELEVAERIIYRDFDCLKFSWDAPLVYDRHKKGYYYSEPTWKFPSFFLSEEELLALAIAKNALIHYSKLPYENRLRKVFEKIINNLPEDEAPMIDDLEDKISFRFGAGRSFDPVILDLVAKALRHKKSIKIVYYSAGKDEISERVVDPYHLENLRGDWYLFGHCHWRDAIRLFCINRIKECYLLENRFEVNPNFSHQDYIKNAFGILYASEPVDVKVQFFNLEARMVKEREWHESQEIEDLEDGSVIIKLHVTGLEEVKRWVLSSGRDARVLEPEWFREDIVHELARAAERYNNA